eukprot:2802476-Prymnesium_polylepis.1
MYFYPPGMPRTSTSLNERASMWVSDSVHTHGPVRGRWPACCAHSTAVPERPSQGSGGTSHSDNARA